MSSSYLGIPESDGQRHLASDLPLIGKWIRTVQALPVKQYPLAQLSPRDQAKLFEKSPSRFRLRDGPNNTVSLDTVHEDPPNAVEPDVAAIFTSPNYQRSQAKTYELFCAVEDASPHADLLRDEEYSRLRFNGATPEYAAAQANKISQDYLTGVGASLIGKWKEERREAIRQRCQHASQDQASQQQASQKVNAIPRGTSFTTIASINEVKQESAVDRLSYNSKFAQMRMDLGLPVSNPGVQHISTTQPASGTECRQSTKWSPPPNDDRSSPDHGSETAPGSASSGSPRSSSDESLSDLPPLAPATVSVPSGHDGGAALSFVSTSQQYIVQTESQSWSSQDGQLAQAQQPVINGYGGYPANLQLRPFDSPSRQTNIDDYAVTYSGYGKAYRPCPPPKPVDNTHGLGLLGAGLSQVYLAGSDLNKAQYGDHSATTTFTSTNAGVPLCPTRINGLGSGILVPSSTVNPHRGGAQLSPTRINGLGSAVLAPSITVNQQTKGLYSTSSSTAFYDQLLSPTFPDHMAQARFVQQEAINSLIYSPKSQQAQPQPAPPQAPLSKDPYDRYPRSMTQPYPGVVLYDVACYGKDTDIFPEYWTDKKGKAARVEHKLKPLRLVDDRLGAASGSNAVANESLHVFVDLSNIIIGFYDNLKTKRGIPITQRVNPPPFSFKNFDTIISRGRDVEKKVVAGSQGNGSRKWPAYMEEAKALCYEMNILQRVLKPVVQPAKKRSRGAIRDLESATSGPETSGDDFNPGPMKNGEQGVDELLHLKILQSAIDASGRCGTMVIATGDAAHAEYSDGFKKNAERALSFGWKVELYGWSRNISSAWRDPEFLARWEAQFRIIELDQFAEELFDMTIESLPL